MKMIRLLVIDDHDPVIVGGLKRMFFPKRDGIRVACYARSVQEACEKFIADCFDIIILDLWLENRLPIENIKTLQAKFPGKAIVIYTAEDGFCWIKAMMENGAFAYVIKSARRNELEIAIIKASKGEKCIPAKFIEAQQTFHLFPDADTGSERLTPLERDILCSLTVGMSHKEIAARFGVSSSFIERVLKSLRKQNHAKNNIELISLLLSRGYLTPPDIK
jgi:DNA-binding NarL/FixJ family response regulator